jgi:hypothetical protein
VLRIAHERVDWDRADARRLRELMASRTWWKIEQMTHDSCVMEILAGTATPERAAERAAGRLVQMQYLASLRGVDEDARREAPLEPGEATPIPEDEDTSAEDEA